MTAAGSRVFALLPVEGSFCLFCSTAGVNSIVTPLRVEVRFGNDMFVSLEWPHGVRGLKWLEKHFHIDMSSRSGSRCMVTLEQRTIDRVIDGMFPSACLG